MGAGKCLVQTAGDTRCSDAIHDGDASLEVLQLEAAIHPLVPVHDSGSCRRADEAGTCRVDAAEEVTRGGGISVVEEFRRAGQD